MAAFFLLPHLPSYGGPHRRHNRRNSPFLNAESSSDPFVHVDSLIHDPTALGTQIKPKFTHKFRRWVLKKMTDCSWICTSIGKRYARTDELGVPFAITVDKEDSVTIRERDSKQQIRVNVNEVASVIKEVTEGQSTWADVQWRYPSHSSASADE